MVLKKQQLPMNNIQKNNNPIAQSQNNTVQNSEYIQEMIIAQQHYFSGPLPSPENLEQYKKIGVLDNIVTIAMDSNNRQNKKVEILASENRQKELLNIAKARKINVNTTIEAVTQIIMAVTICLIVLSCWGVMIYGLIVKNYPASVILAGLNAIAVLIAFLQKKK